MAADAATLRLSGRLRELREGWPDQPVTQKHLSTAFDVSVPLISSWENKINPATPGEEHLQRYARFFATRRSLDGGRGRLLPEHDLTEQEETRRRAVASELLALRAAAVGQQPQPAGTDEFVNELRESDAAAPWRFPKGEVITIACAALPDDKRPRTTDPRDADHIEAYQYADLDSLLELYGYIRAVNPDSVVNIRAADAMAPEDMTAHLVVIGGVDWNPVASEILAAASPQIRQMGRPEEEDIGAFQVVSTGQTFAPTITADGRLAEDVGHFLRVPNPLNAIRTLISCNGNYARGVFGVVKALSDVRFRTRNARYLAERFPGADAVSILCRVRVVAGAVVVPDWTQSVNRLHEWPEATG